MELILNDGDLQPKFSKTSASLIKFHMFSDEAKKAIKLVGKAMWKGNQTHQAVYPPE